MPDIHDFMRNNVFILWRIPWCCFDDARDAADAHVSTDDNNLTLLQGLLQCTHTLTNHFLYPNWIIWSHMKVHCQTTRKTTKHFLHDHKIQISISCIDNFVQCKIILSNIFLNWFQFFNLIFCNFVVVVWFLVKIFDSHDYYLCSTTHMIEIHQLPRRGKMLGSNY